MSVDSVLLFSIMTAATARLKAVVDLGHMVVNLRSASTSHSTRMVYSKEGRNRRKIPSGAILSVAFCRRVILMQVLVAGGPEDVAFASSFSPWQIQPRSYEEPCHGRVAHFSTKSQAHILVKWLFGVPKFGNLLG